MASIGISGKKPLITKPPDKGSFPLDHDGECKQVMIDYLKCLQKTDCENASCRDLAKKYFTFLCEKIVCNHHNRGFGIIFDCQSASLSNVDLENCRYEC